MRVKIIPLLRLTAGLLLLMVGVVGLVLPFLQGWLFILIAIPLISPTHGKKMIEKLKILKNRLKNYIFK